MDDVRVAARVVEALAAERLIPVGAEEEARRVVAAALATPERPGGGGAEPPVESAAMPRLVEVVAYLGAALVLAAGFLFVLRSWSDLGDVGQVSFLSAVAVVLAVAGAATVPRGEAAGRSDVRRRLSGTLLTGGALSAGVAVGVALEVFTDTAFGDVYWPGVAGGVVTVLGAAAAYRFASTAVGLVAMVGGALDVAANLGSGLAAGPSDEQLGVGIAVFATAVLWVLLTELGMFDQLSIARSLGVAVAVVGAQITSFTGDWAWLGYLMSAVVAGVGVWLYLSRQDWPYLAAAVIAVTLVVPEAVSDWTEGSLGVVGGVLVAGVTLLLASFAGYRIRRTR